MKMEVPYPRVLVAICGVFLFGLFVVYTGMIQPSSVLIGEVVETGMEYSSQPDQYPQYASPQGPPGDQVHYGDQQETYDSYVGFDGPLLGTRLGSNMGNSSVFNKSMDMAAQRKPSEYDGFQRAAMIPDLCRLSGLPEFEQSTSGPGNKHKYYFLMADDKHKTIYCAISKCSSTSWKNLLVRMQGKSSAPSGGGIHGRGFLKKNGLVFFNYLTLQEAKLRLDTYFKYLIVRHPLDRLYSAYRDKILSPDEGSYKKRILRMVQEYRDPGHGDFIRQPEFHEFVHAVETAPPRSADRHWLSAYHHCHPCHVKYDFVVKVETLGDDLPQIFKQYNETPISMGHLNAHGSGKADLGKYYANVTVREYHKLLEMYRDDLILFGYSDPIFHTVL